MPPLPPSSKASFAKITEILKAGTFPIPDEGFGGSGAPGRMLEHLLGVSENNADSPDLADWEVKFHGGKSLLTLLHKNPEPGGIIDSMVDYYGWDDKHGRVSFRHTIKGASKRGFVVENGADRITIRNLQKPEGPAVYWLHDTLFNAFSGKLRRLIVVDGKMVKDPRSVTYKTATAYWEPRLSILAQAIVDGIFRVDFDARTNGPRGTSVRDHGTKFRIRPEHLAMIYTHKTEIPA